MRTPGALEAEIKLENALPVAGFVTESDKMGSEYRRADYIRSGKLQTAPGQADQLIEIIRKEVPALLSPESEVLSFVALNSLEAEDTVIIWERFSSEEAFQRTNASGGVYARSMDNIKDMVTAGKMTEYVPILGYLSQS